MTFRQSFGHETGIFLHIICKKMLASITLAIYTERPHFWLFLDPFGAFLGPLITWQLLKITQLHPERGGSKSLDD